MSFRCTFATGSCAPGDHFLAARALASEAQSANAPQAQAQQPDAPAREGDAQGSPSYHTFTHEKFSPLGRQVKRIGRGRNQSSTVRTILYKRLYVKKVTEESSRLSGLAAKRTRSAGKGQLAERPLSEQRWRLTRRPLPAVAVRR